MGMGKGAKKKCCMMAVPLIFTLVVGAGLFNAIEGSKELKAYTKAKLDHGNARAKISHILTQHAAGTFTPEETYDKIAGELGDSCQGFTDPDPSTVWDFGNSMLFGFTLVTTIGYGTQAAGSTAGKKVTILYSLVGIPLCLGCIGFLAKSYIKVTEGIYRDLLHIDLDSTRGKKLRFLYTLASLGLYFFFGIMVFSVTEGWTFFESFYFCFVTLTTIGLGDYYPASGAGQWFWLFYSSMGLGVLSITISMGVLFAIDVFKTVAATTKNPIAS